LVGTGAFASTYPAITSKVVIACFVRENIIRVFRVGHLDSLEIAAIYVDEAPLVQAPIVIKPICCFVRSAAQIVARVMGFAAGTICRHLSRICWLSIGRLLLGTSR